MEGEGCCSDEIKREISSGRVCVCGFNGKTTVKLRQGSSLGTMRWMTPEKKRLFDRLQCLKGRTVFHNFVPPWSRQKG